MYNMKKYYFCGMKIFSLVFAAKMFIIYSGNKIVFCPENLQYLKTCCFGAYTLISSLLRMWFNVHILLLVVLIM